MIVLDGLPERVGVGDRLAVCVPVGLREDVWLGVPVSVVVGVVESEEPAEDVPV